MLKIFITVLAFVAAVTAQGTIPEVAETAQQFNTLLELVSTAGLFDTLSSEGPFTVFAPVDGAFDAVGEEELNRLRLEENREELTNLLLGHVVAGEIDATAAVAAGSATALNGGLLRFEEPAPGSPTVNGVTIIGANVGASNGIIHVVDQVVITESASQIPTEGGEGSAMTPAGEGSAMTPAGEGSASSSDDDDDSSSDDDDDSSSSDDDDSSMDEAMTPEAMTPEGEAGETYDDILDEVEEAVDAIVAKVTGELTRAEVKALKDEIDELKDAFQARCDEAMSGDSDDDDDDSSSSSKRSSSDDDDDSSVSDSHDCAHEVADILRDGRKSVTKDYWSARSSSSSDDDDDSSSDDDDDSSSSR